MSFLLVAAVLIYLIARLKHRTQSGTRRAKVWYAIGAAICGITLIIICPNTYILQKIIGRLAMPTGLLWMTIAITGILASSIRHWRMALACGLVWASLTVCGSPLIGSWLISSLERPYGQIDVYAQPKFDAVLVLGGGVSGGGNYAQLSDSGDRPIVAARMYHRGLIDTLITSGSSIPGMGTQVDVAATTTIIWKDLGIPESAIIRVPAPKNTSEEIRDFKHLALQNTWERIGLITSAFHMRRAMRLADKNGLKIEPLPSDFKANSNDQGALSWIPDWSGFAMVQRACWEYLGALVGR